MKLYLLIAAIITVIGGAVFSTKDFHMLQQNSYYNSRYFKWLRSNSEGYITRILWFVIVSFCCAFKWIGVIAAAVYTIAAFLVVRSSQKKAIKPLVFTMRVIRMYITECVVLFGAAALAVFVNEWFFLLLFLLAVETPFSVILANVINIPVEKMIRAGFIRDAKRIIKANDKLRIIGITGSYGKTSTKYFLARILEERYNLTYTPGSFNTPMGVVRTIRERLKPSDEIFICEMGAKNIGDIKEICDIVHPSLGIITSVGPQHLETFKTIENVAKTKFELADEVNRNGGKVYVNADSSAALEKASEYDCITYGTGDAELNVSNISCNRFGSTFTVKYKGEQLVLSTKVLGVHNVLDVAGAVAVAIDLGVEARDIKYAVERIKPVEHRLEIKPFVNGSVLIDDAYNSNPAGSAEAVNVLASFDGMKRIIVTPGMVELGEKEYECNRELGRHAANMLDELIFVGEERSKPLAEGANTVEAFDKDNIHVVATFKDAMALLRKIADSKTAILFENDLPDNYAK